ncbi:MAG: hypothetical protein ACREGB_05575 [Candidatus Saccharimonadales bacterium]
MKPRDLNEVSREVEAIADNLGMPIDEGIKAIVVALRVWQFPTDGSCEGHLPPREGYPYPWVDMCEPENDSTQLWKSANAQLRKRLERCIEEYYAVSGKSAPLYLQPIGIFGAFRLVPKDFDQGVASETKLAKDQRELHDFAQYLLEQVN